MLSLGGVYICICVCTCIYMLVTLLCNIANTQKRNDYNQHPSPRYSFC